jgi:hypothetical protein
VAHSSLTQSVQALPSVMYLLQHLLQTLQPLAGLHSGVGAEGVGAGGVGTGGVGTGGVGVAGVGTGGVGVAGVGTAGVGIEVQSTTSLVGGS